MRYQSALIKSELEDLFATCRQDPRVVNAELQAAYEQATGALAAPQRR